MKLKLGDSVKELYEKMARRIRDIATDDSLSFTKKSDLIWKAFEKINYEVIALIDNKLPVGYNEGCKDLSEVIDKAGYEERTASYDLFADGKPGKIVPSKVQKDAAGVMEQLRKEGCKAINILIASILDRDYPHTENGIRTRELNEFVVFAKEQARSLEVRAYAASRGRMAI